MMIRIKFFRDNLRKINKLDEWIKRTPSAPYSVVVGLPLKEKVKYHNSLTSFYDKVMKENKPPSTEPVLDSSPTAPSLGGGFPDLDDPTKFEKMK